MGPDTAAAATMYCRQCGYALVGLSENRCPECGKTFDPADARTCVRSLRWWQVRTWLRRASVAVCCLLALLAIITGVPLGVLYGQYRAEQKIIARFDRETIHVEACVMPAPWHEAVYYALFDNGLPWHESGRMGEFVLQLTTRVRLVTLFFGASLNQEDIASLTGLHYLDSVSVCGTHMADHALEHLERIEHLQDLALSSVTLRDEDLAPIGRLRRLRDLTLRTLPITDAALEPLAGCASLERLDLDCENITDAGLVPIGRIATLRELSLRTQHVTGEGLAHLQGLSHLERLHVWSPQVATIARLKGFKNLRTLHLSNCNIADAELVHLRDLPTLKVLQISDVPLTDAAVDSLLALPNVAIGIDGTTRMSDAALDRICPPATQPHRVPTCGFGLPVEPTPESQPAPAGTEPAE